jgi:hypothetical protein
MNVDDFIKYIVENGMKRFPALVNALSEEWIYEQLKTNIKAVDKVEKFPKKNVLGCYIYDLKKIELLSKQELNEELLESSFILKVITIHECIHALFARDRENTGLEKIDFDKSKLENIHIKEEIQTFFSSKTIKSKMEALSRVNKGFKNYNRLLNKKNLALNEGLTEWIARNCMNGYGAVYDAETTIYNQLSYFRKKEDIVLLGKANQNDINKVFNMNEEEFSTFSKNMDARLFAGLMCYELSQGKKKKNLVRKIYNIIQINRKRML